MQVSKNRIRIAIADDHKMFRNGIVELLSRSFDVVAEANNGKEFIELIGKQKDQPDVCLLDIDMPVLDGYETLVRLRETYPLMKFLVLTMQTKEFAVIRMLRNGANGYLLKEDDIEELKRAIEYVASHDDLYDNPTTRTVRKGNHVDMTANEQTFLKLCCTDLIYKEIATQMGLSVRTVEGYRDELFRKLGVNTRIGLVIYALKNGLANL